MKPTEQQKKALADAFKKLMLKNHRRNISNRLSK